MSSHKSNTKSNPLSPQRRPSGSLRRFIARHGSNLPSSSSSSSLQQHNVEQIERENEATLIPIRPEALRPFLDKNSSTSRDESTYTPSNEPSSSRSIRKTFSPNQQSSANVQQSHLDQNTQSLAQAANYASLANLNKSSQTQHSLGQIDQSNPNSLQSNLKVDPSSSSNRKEVCHRLIRTKSGRRVIQTIRSIAHPSIQIGSTNQDSPQPSFQEIDHQEWETAPRLSMSSVESSVGSEVKTPESMNANLSWQCANGEKRTMQSAFVAPESDGPLSVSPRLTPSSPALVEMSDAFHHAQGLAAAGFSTAEDVVQSSLDPALIHAARNMDDESDYQMNATPVNTDLNRHSATIKLKRPDDLLKLPGKSFQTDRTITPTTSEHGSLGQLYCTNPDEPQLEEKPDVSVPANALQRTENDPSTSENGNVLESAQFPRYTTPFPAIGSLSPAIEGAASPDSWRTLLPEHDRFYIPSEALSSRTSSMAGSDILQQRNFKTLSDSTSDRRRWSNDSNHVGNGHDNSRTTLYDLDGSFGGARAAFAPLRYSYDQSSRSLTSSSFADQESIANYSEPMQRQMTNIDQHSSTSDMQKRHASFSAFDKGKWSHRSTFQQSPFVPSDLTANKLKRSTAMSISSSVASSLASVGAISPGLISVVAEAQEGADDDKPHYTVTPFYVPQTGARKQDVPIHRGDWPSSSRSSISAQAQAVAPFAEVLQSEPFLTDTDEVLAEAFEKSFKEGLSSHQSASKGAVPVNVNVNGETSPFADKMSSSTFGLYPETSGRTYSAEQDDLITKRVVSTITTTTTVVKEEEDLHIEQYVNRYYLRTNLPGFTLDRIILETKRDHQLRITAETQSENEEGIGRRFERKIKFGPDANLKATRAHFDGFTLHINVPRTQLDN